MISWLMQMVAASLVSVCSALWLDISFLEGFIIGILSLILMNQHTVKQDVKIKLIREEE